MQRSLFVTIAILVLLLTVGCSARVAAQPTPPYATATLAPPKNRPTKVPTREKDFVATSTHPDFIATEILGRPTDNSVTVNVVPSKEMEIFYEYGSATGAYTQNTPTQILSAGTPTETVLTELQPGTRFYYRIRYRTGSGDYSAGQEHTFMTQRSPGSTFTFAIQGDSHPERVRKQFNPELYTRTLLTVAASQPDFYITIGDDFSVDALKIVNQATVTQRYLHQRSFLGLIGNSAPLFLVNGNHEQAALYNLDGTPDNVAVWAQNARNLYYPQPAPDNFYSGDSQPVEYIGLLRDYYAWTWGDALFVVIDPYWHSTVPVDNVFGSGDRTRDMWGITLGEAQYQWFRQTLERSTARYKFVFAHHVNGTGRGGIELAGLYEWGGRSRQGAWEFDQKRPGWEKPIHQVMSENGVTIFFQGHDHLFARQELDGVTYQTLPVPADPHYALDNVEAYLSGDILPASGYVRVTVSLAVVTVEYIRSFLPQDEWDGHINGEIAFSYTVQP